MMKKNRLSGCPAPQEITLSERLRSLLGERVRLFLPGRPVQEDRLVNVGESSFQVGKTTVRFDSPFVLELLFFSLESVPILVRVKVRGLGTFTGLFVRLGQGFIEIEQELPEDINRLIIPVNGFTEFRCGELNEE